MYFSTWDQCCSRDLTYSRDRDRDQHKRDRVRDQTGLPSPRPWMSQTETKTNSCKVSDKFQVQLKGHINVLKSHGSKLLLLLLFTKMSLTPEDFIPKGRFTDTQVYGIRNSLRGRAFFHKTVRVCHVNCNFKIGFKCWITVIFGSLKDGSLLINTLASNIWFSHRNMFQNGVDTLSNIVDAFLSKSSKFHLVQIIR